MNVYTSLPVPFTTDDIPARQESNKVLLCSPEHFDIVDEKNVHMKGNIGSTNRNRALDQWNSLRSTYESIKTAGMLDEVAVLPGADGCEDMVFCANQSFPWILQDGRKVVVMSNMRHASRQREVLYFEKFFKEKGFEPLYLPSEIHLEGMGDIIPHPGRRLLYGGYGHRTAAEAYELLSEILGTPVIALELVSEKFYHLDTCFVPLSESSVMLCKEAFSEEGLALIRHFFRTVHFIPEEEAVQYFSLNAHAIMLQGKKVAVLHPGSTVTKNVLIEEGFEVTELDTSEFMKSGGSVFCMKMMYP